MTQSTNNKNRLANEKSPYLLQHANNPVDWYPWGEEAFKKAKEEDKPVFLSIGYSCCHWCHVMAHESFEDAQVAEVLNRYFVSVKVDREERPDVDAVYMAACQAFTGRGGWPLTILMTPDQQPFYAGTYFPRRSQYGMYGLIELLTAVAAQWQEGRQELTRAGGEMTGFLSEDRTGGRQPTLSDGLIRRAADSLTQTFDEEYGGFGKAPKFPAPHNLMFLLRYYSVSRQEKYLHMVEKTLEQMARGGIFDHIGYGFSRYSTDIRWLVPHFEKMLYDNALLTMIYLEAYQATGREMYKTVATRVMEYVANELTLPEGGFCSAEDADSEGVEGKYYVFTPDEITALLGEEDGKAFNSVYGITETGNFEGKSIPNLLSRDEPVVTDPRMEPLRNRVKAYRKERTALHKDDKCLTAWNALMIAAYARAYKILSDEKYLAAATRAMSLIDARLTDNKGNLYIRYRDGETAGEGLLDDYACCAFALLELYEATLSTRYLEKATAVAMRMAEHFFDGENGGFYLYGHGAEQLIFRPKELYDGAVPSGNSVAAYVLTRLARLTGIAELEELSNRQLRFMAGNIQTYPAGSSFALCALLMAVYPSREVVCVLHEQEDLQKIRAVLAKTFAPNTVFTMKDEKAAPITQGYSLHNGRTTFYVCENKTCGAPVNDIEQAIRRES